MNKHPDKLSDDDINAALAKRERKLSRKKMEEAVAMAMFGDILDMLDSK